MIFRQLIDAKSWTYTYLLADAESKEAILIDPVFEQVRRDCALLDELGLTLTHTLDTHVHADHVTGAWLLREKLGSKIALMEAAGATGADVLLNEGDIVSFGSRFLSVFATPGHTSGCGSFVLDNSTMAFPGDCLLVRGCGRTDFQQGSSKTMYESIHSKLFTLPDTCMLYPGHDYQGRMMTTVGEEKEHNPRVGGRRSENDFVTLMNTLGLPHPAQIDVAMPANLLCGQPCDQKPMPEEPSWAPLRYSFAGIWQVPPSWLMEHASEVQIVDVRPAQEVQKVLGTIEGSLFLSLENLLEEAKKLDVNKPVVIICRSGGRSAQATLKLQKQGFAQVANLEGGVLAYEALGGTLSQNV